MTKEQYAELHAKTMQQESITISSYSHFNKISPVYLLFLFHVFFPIFATEAARLLLFLDTIYPVPSAINCAIFEFNSMIGKCIYH